MQYITVSPDKYAGFGHKFHNFMSGYIVAKDKGFKFYSKPIHAKIRNKPKQQYLGFKNWANFFQIHDLTDALPRQYSQIALPKIELNNQAIEKLKIWDKIFKENQNKNTVFEMRYNQLLPVVYEKIRDCSQDLGAIFWKDKKKFDFENDFLNIAIHIRRGDVYTHFTQNNKCQARWREIDYYQKIIDFLETKYNNSCIHIFSEGKKELFNLKLKNGVYHLNENDFKTFHMMASADILVTGMSSFSIVAAYVNKNITYYTKCLQLTEWENFEKKYNIDNLI